MALPLAIPLALGGAKLLTDLFGASKQSRYQKRALAAQKENESRLEREARKKSLMRALGVQETGFTGPKLLDIPEPPSMVGNQTLSGLLDFGGNLATTYAAQAPKPKWKPTPGRSYV